MNDFLPQRWRVARWALVVALTVASANAHADECSKAEMAGAKEHYNLGAKAFRIGELVHAADEFKQAYSACASPLFLYNLGQTYRQLKEYDKALFSYRQYLSTTPPEDERRPTVQKWVTQIEAQLESQKPAAPAVSSSSSAAVTPTPAPAPVVAAEPTQPARRDVRSYRRLGLGLAIGGVVLAGVGAGLAGYAAALHSQAQRATVLGDQRSAGSRSDSTYDAAWPLVGVGAAALAGGVVLIALSYGGHRSTQVVQR